MSKSKLFYEIVSEVLPAGTRKAPAERLETKTAITIKSVGSDPLLNIGDNDAFSDLYQLKPAYAPPNIWKEVEPEIWFTGITGPCSICKKGTYYRTFIPESVSLCSRTCHERFKL